MGAKREDGASVFAKTPPCHLFRASFHRNLFQTSLSDSILTPSVELTEAQFTDGPSFSWVTTNSPPQVPLGVNGPDFENFLPESLLLSAHTGSGPKDQNAEDDVLWRGSDW